jgi:hypothetical protein
MLCYFVLVSLLALDNKLQEQLKFDRCEHLKVLPSYSCNNIVALLKLSPSVLPSTKENDSEVKITLLALPHVYTINDEARLSILPL